MSSSTLRKLTLVERIFGVAAQPTRPKVGVRPTPRNTETHVRRSLKKAGFSEENIISWMMAFKHREATGDTCQRENPSLVSDELVNDINLWIDFHRSQRAQIAERIAAEYGRRYSVRPADLDMSASYKQWEDLQTGRAILAQVDELKRQIEALEGDFYALKLTDDQAEYLLAE